MMSHCFRRLVLLLQGFGPCIPSRMADASHIMVTTLAPLPVSEQ
jgi:hypothetical protein